MTELIDVRLSSSPPQLVALGDDDDREVLAAAVVFDIAQTSAIGSGFSGIEDHVGAAGDPA